MNYGIVFEEIEEPGFAGQYYAHIPTLGLTTQGEGIDGAREAALDLVVNWLQAKMAKGEDIPPAHEVLFSTLDIPDDALQTA